MRTVEVVLFAACVLLNGWLAFRGVRRWRRGRRASRAYIGLCGLLTVFLVLAIPLLRAPAVPDNPDATPLDEPVLYAPIPLALSADEALAAAKKCGRALDIEGHYNYQAFRRDVDAVEVYLTKQVQARNAPCYTEYSATCLVHDGRTSIIRRYTATGHYGCR